jgi:hypothetical protein
MELLLRHIQDFSSYPKSKHNILSIQINHQLDARVSPVYYPGVYLQLNMFRASLQPSSRAQQLQ